MRREVAAVVVVLAGLAAMGDALIEEKLTLAKGWNGVYLEATPTDADCETFFADLPAVTRVGAYLPDAYEATAQMDDEGREINQKPVSYYVWNRGKGDLSTLRSMRGGHCYLIYATDACAKTFRGTPGVPHLSWRESSASEGLANLVGASVPAEVTDLAINTYFCEGPAGFGASVWQVGGTGESPTLKSLGLFKSPKLSPGAAYVMGATRTADWPGVVGVSGALGGIAFVSNGTDQVGIFVSNNSATNRVFSLTYGAGADGAVPPPVNLELASDWVTLTNGASVRLALAAGEQKSLNFALDRSTAAGNTAGGGILAIADTGATKMRVRVPVTVEPRPTSTQHAAWPAGFWVGSLAFNKVNYGTNATPVAAGGTVNATILLNWTAENRVSLLQRASLGSDPTTGRLRVFRTLEAARTALVGVDDKAIRRVSCMLMDPEQPVITATNAVVSVADGASLGFAWTVGKYASTNPMRHSWHPDHDGVTYKTDGTVELAPDGDKLENYTYPTKPELFSIGNLVELTLTDTGWTPDETMKGTVRWELTGVKSPKNGPVICTGTLTLRRVSDNAELE